MSARIVFDLDGTLIDSAPDLHGIANTLLEARGLAPITLAQTRDFIGNGVDVLVTRIREARDIPEARHEALLGDFVTRYQSAVTLTTCYPGVIRALETLKAQGHRLGICTNKPIGPTRAVLAHLELAQYFDAVLGGDSLTVHKPDPAPLHAAFAALGPGPRLYVGDSGVDAETARRAGVPFLLYTEGYRKQPVAEMQHDAGFDDFAALPGLVEQVLAATA